jgi:hypothetical protein
MKGRGTKARRRRLFWCPLRQWMQDSTDTTRVFGGGTMSLTLEAQGTATTVSDAGGREHPHRPLVFGASLLRRERGPLPTPQRSVSLWEENLALPGFLLALHAPIAGDASSWSSWREGRGWQRFSLRGGKLGETHRGRLPLLAQFLAQLPSPVCKNLPDAPFQRWWRNSTDHCLAHDPHQPAPSRSCPDAGRA